MKISNTSITNENLNYLIATISFDIEDANEKVDVFIKINDGDYKQVLSNQSNTTVTYTIRNLKRGINYVNVKLSNKDEEYISKPIIIKLKKNPSIEDLKCIYTDGTGKFTLSFSLVGDELFSYTVDIKVDDGEYYEAMICQVQGEKSYTSTNSKGYHTCKLRVSDGYDTYESETYSFEIIDQKPILSKILVADISNEGTADVYYAVKDVENKNLEHILNIDGVESKITPNKIDDFCFYELKDLSIGTHVGKIKISDGTTTIVSDEFTIEIFENTEDKKEILRQSKIRYDFAYQNLKDVIRSVVADGIFDYGMEGAIIQKAQEYYTEVYTEFNRIAQQTIDIIGTNKVILTKQDLESQIEDVDYAISNLGNTMSTTFKDGLLTEAEKDMLRNDLDIVAKEKIDIDKDYETLYTNEDLIDDAKSNLFEAYETFVQSHNALMMGMDELINKVGIIDNKDKDNISLLFENWRNALGDYRTRSLEAIDSIAKKKADDSSDKVDKKWAEIILDPEEGIISQVGNLQETVDGVNERIAKGDVTANGVSTTVSSMQSVVDGFDSRIAGAESRVEQLSDKITSQVMTTEDVQSIIEQSPYSVKFGFNGISDYVTINSSGLTVLYGSIACDTLTTPEGHDPVINLFTSKGRKCQIDARNSDGGSFGGAIRLKYDDDNYMFISDNVIEFYQDGIGTFQFSHYETGSKISTNNGALVFDDAKLVFYQSNGSFNNVSMDGHSHGRLENSSNGTGSQILCQQYYVDITASDGVTINGKQVSVEGHSHSKYSETGHSHSSISTGESYVDCYSGSLYIGSPEIYLEGYTRISSSLDPSSTNSYNLGYREARWNQVVAKDVYADYCSGSDIGIKENIRYIKSDEVSMLADVDDVINPNEKNNIDLGLTGSDLYYFVKNDLRLCEYNYKDEYLADSSTREITRTNLDNKLGFIAQDIQDTKVGNLIVGDWEGQLSYNLNNYVSVIGGALQYEVAIRDSQIENLESTISDLEERIKELENKLK